MISFKEYFLCERNDSEKIKRAERFVKSVFEKLNETIEGTYYTYPIDYRGQTGFRFTISNTVIQILSSNGKEDGGYDYKNNTINIYNSNLWYLLQTCNKIRESILKNEENSLLDNKLYMKVHYYDFIKIFKKESGQIRDTVFHEYIHSIEMEYNKDYVNTKDKFFKNWRDSKDKIVKARGVRGVDEYSIVEREEWLKYYFNSEHELNAWFLTKARNIFKSKNVKTFEDVVKSFKNSFSIFWQHLSLESKKRLLKRLYSYYEQKKNTLKSKSKG